MGTNADYIYCCSSGCSQYTAYSTELNGARGVRVQISGSIVCKLDITRYRECYCANYRLQVESAIVFV